MLNKEAFLRDPTTFEIPNDGVTSVEYPETSEQWSVLRYELRSFVCEGEYYKGMKRVLETYLAHLQREKQPAVWVSGFYGSGKSHFVRMLEHFWRNVTFEDGVEARGLADLPADIESLLRQLSSQSQSLGGLWATAGKLSASANIHRDILEIILRSAGLPTRYASARFVIWMKKQEIYEEVKTAVEAAGKNFDFELENMFVSPVLAEALLQAQPGFAANQREVRNFLRAQYPHKDAISNEEMLRVVEDTLSLVSSIPGKLPCTLLVLDEMQQALKEDPGRTLTIQDIVEALTSRFGSRLLVVGTGQSAIQATPQLQKLEGRFTVRVELSDRDVEKVVREVVLRKEPSKVPELKRILEETRGEIDRHLMGTKIAPAGNDTEDLLADYPLLPTRRRFWERVLRAIDTGTAAQLRTQLRIIHEATQKIADDSLGTVVGADFIYDQQKPAMLQSGVLLSDLAAIIAEQDDGSPDGELRSRLCATIFLIGQLPQSGAAATGIQANATTLADLLVEDLRGGSSSLRQRIPTLLKELTEEGTLMEVEGQYKLQTRESAEWERDFRRSFGSIRGDTPRIASDRAAELRKAVSTTLKKVRLTQGANKVPRKIQLEFGHEKPSTNTTAVPVWVQDGWSISEKAVKDEAIAEGTESPLVFVLLPRRQSDALTSALASVAAAQSVLNRRPSQQTTPEGLEAQRAMETRLASAQRNVKNIVDEIVEHARVYQAGGNEVVQDSFPEAVERAAENALLRLFPEFDVTDVPGWGRVVKRAGKGAPDALEAVGYMGNPDKHPATRLIMDFIGADGRRGNVVRKKFTGIDYGWPKDAVDGILLTLLNGGFINATSKSGQLVNAKQIPQSQIGVTTFRREGYVLKTVQKIQLRSLAMNVGLPVQEGEEAAAVQRVLQRMIDLSEEVSGAPPLPKQPDIDYIRRLQSYRGNEQLVRVHEHREQLLEDYESWSELQGRKDQRLQRWELLKRLLDHARNIEVEKAVRPQFEAIREQRLLLNKQDPVKPLLDQLTAALRQALKAARKQVVEARERELKAIQATEEWQQLPDREWRELFQDHHLGPVDKLDLSTDDHLLEELSHKPLNAWATELEAIPTRIRRAREEAAQRIAPQAVRVRPPSTTLETEADVDAYLSELRQQIMEHIDEGKPVII